MKKKEAAYYLCANASVDEIAVKYESPFSGPVDCDIFTQNPDVNHIEPCHGKHSKWGCWHHQENLEVLCKPCHKKITATQATERAQARANEREQT